MDDSNLIILEAVYAVENGLKFIKDNLIIKDNSIKYVFHFQTVDCAKIYAINSNPTEIIMSKYHLYQNLIKGIYDIGIVYINNFNTITNIKSYNDADCDEIRLHYTESRSNTNNIAWRSINWDLFEDIIKILNSEEDNE
jgi:hypothetical protein